MPRTRVLLVDDDPSSLALLAHSLRYGDYEILQAPDGQRAWEIWQQEQIRLIITDWLMPELTGPELVRRIREANRPEYTYIIMITVVDEKPMMIRGLRSGLDDYLTKPFDADELLVRVSIGERILQLEERLQHSTQQMQFLAMHDPLTGLFNRRAIQEQIEAELCRAAREGYPVGLVLMDVDHFKSINDDHGHVSGDRALVHVSRVLSQSVRPYDRVGRWGGEEFLVVLPGTDQGEVTRIAERIRGAVATSRCVLSVEETISLQVSIGALSVPFAPDSAPPALDGLVRRVDTALYEAKRAGRNRVCITD